MSPRVRRIDCFLLTVLSSLVLSLGCKDETTLHRLQVQAGGDGGSGSIATSDGSLACNLSPGGACGLAYESDVSLTVTATPVEGSVFAGWTGACSGLGDCRLNMSRDRLLTALFDIGNFAITVRGEGSGSGTVTSEPGPTPTINCTVSAGTTSNACQGSYLAGTTLQLNATPAEGSDFIGWTGHCTGTGTCPIEVLRQDSVKAVFTLKSFSLSLLRSGTGSGTVTSQGGLNPAINCINPAGPAAGCTATYPFGTEVQLTAVPGASSTFGGWGNSCGTALTCAVTVRSDTTVNAPFNPQTFVVTVAGAGAGSGQVTTTAGTIPAIDCNLTPQGATGTCSGSYNVGTSVTLQQAPAGGSQFGGWSGACTVSPCVLTTTGTATATFTIQPLTLTVTGSGSGAGLITSQGLNPAIACTITGSSTSGSCTQSYPPNTPVTLTATAGATATFSGWSGGCSGTGNCQFNLTQSTTVNASFSSNQALTVVPAGDGDGSVQSQNGLNPAINCTILNGTPTAGAACSQTYAANTPVTLTATASTGTTFTGWSLASCPGTAPCPVTAGQVSSVTATFTKQSFALTIGGTGSGSGTVTAPAATPPLSCTITGGTPGAGCQQTYKFGTQVALSATPSAGSSFSAWTLPAGQGPCATANCTVTVTGALTVTAGFTANTPQLTVTLAGTGSGTVAIPAGVGPAIICGPGGTPSPCTAGFGINTPVTLTSSATTGSTFAGWSGDCTGTGTCQVTISQARNVTATFNVQTFSVTVLGTGTGGGVVTTQAGLIPAINCPFPGASCAATYPFNTTVTLTATQANGSLFTGWTTTPACTGFGPCQFQVTQARSVTAKFDLPVATFLGGFGVVSYNAAAGTPVNLPPSVIVRDQRGHPMQGQTVRFAVGGAGGTITPGSPANLLTQPNGIATLTGWTVGTTQGAGAVQATITGSALAPVNFSANGTAPVGLIQVAANSVTLKSRPFSSATAVRSVVVRNGVPGNLTLAVAASVTTQPTDGSGVVVVQFQGQAPGQPVTVTESNSATLLIQTNGDGIQNGGDSFAGTVTLTASSPAGVQPVTMTFLHNFDDNPILASDPYQLVFHSTVGAAAPAPVITQLLNLNPRNSPPEEDIIQDLHIDSITDLQGSPIAWLTTTFQDSTQDLNTANVYHYNTPNHLRVAVSAQPLGTRVARIKISGDTPCFCSYYLFVQYTVDPTPTMELSGTSLAFTQLAGDSPPSSVPIVARNTGVGSLAGVAGTSDTTWVQASGGGTANPTATLNLTFLNTASLAAGTHTAHVTVSSSTGGVVSRTITITFTVLP